MAECAECQALNGAPVSTSPHANLLLHSEADINYGATSTGRMEYYLCHRCGTQWERVQARSEPEAVWQRTTKELRLP